MPQRRHVIATLVSLVSLCVVAATVWASVADTAALDITPFAERRLPVAARLALVVLALCVPVGVLALADDAHLATGLGLAGVASLLPTWAAWPDLGAHWRALVLALGVLVMAGLAIMVRYWWGVAFAGIAALLHALAYDPFRDVGCARVCVQVPVPLELPIRLVEALVAGLVLAAAVGVVVRGARQGSQVRVVVPAGIGLAALAVIRWLTVGDAEAYSALSLSTVVVPGAVAVPAIATWLVLARRRAAASQLADQLTEDPHRLLEQGENLEVSMLTPGRQLALRNAQLSAEARHRLAEVRDSQRRVVAAADAERRRIERDLHDGTQQRLVGVLMHLSGQGMDEVGQQVRGVLANLRAFGEGTFPTVLEEEGLEIALIELAAVSDADLRLSLNLAGRVPAEHARAIYSLVTLAESGTVDVEVTSSDDSIKVVVSGLEADLSLVKDRFGALGGTLTTIHQRTEGVLPCG